MNVLIIFIILLSPDFGRKKMPRFPEYSGSKPKFTKAEEFTQKAALYAEQCNADGDQLTVSGFALCCGMTTEGLRYYEQKKEFKHVIGYIKEWIYNGKFQVALKGDIPVALTIFDAVNNHGMINTRSDNTSNNTNTTDTTVTIQQATVDPALIDMMSGGAATPNATSSAEQTGDSSKSDENQNG